MPEKREELTTEGGLDVIKYSKELEDVIDALKKKGVIVSLFIEPDKKQIEETKKIGAQMIEIHTGHYANYFNNDQHAEELKRIQDGSKYADSIGLEVACGHGLTLQNVPQIARIKEIIEYNIGHSIISKAVFYGLYKAIKDMKDTIVFNRILR